jgi:hypothetical protein
MFGSSLGRDTGYPGGVHGVTQSLQVNSGTVPRLEQEGFPPNPFQFIILHHPNVQRYT